MGKLIMAQQYEYDLFGILQHLDKGDYEYFQNLSDDVIKKIPTFVIMRWQYCTPNEPPISQVVRLLRNNEAINVNCWKNSMADKRLQLLSMVDKTSPAYHTYKSRKKESAKTKQSAADKKMDFLRKHHPEFTDEEFVVWFNELDKDELTFQLDWFGYGL